MPKMGNFFQYNVPKLVIVKTTRNKIFGYIYRTCQLALITYFFIYELGAKKGYQMVEEAESAVTTELKGSIRTNFSDDEFEPMVPNTSLYRRSWDVPDLIVPPLENGAFFIATNVIITPNQRQDRCPESPMAKGARCQDSCPIGVPMKTGQTTGRCVPSSTVPNINVCEIEGWCPVEVKVGPLKNKKPLLAQSADLTVLIKNYINFKGFGVKRRNIITNTTDFENCRYNPVNDTLCPIFRLGDIVQSVASREESDCFNTMACKGGVVAIKINWDCDLDLSIDQCLPQYSFLRLDSSHAPISPGWSFRYADYYSEFRNLYKVRGILFIIQVQASARKFHMLPFLMKLGSGAGLFSFAKVITDFIVLFFTTDKGDYKDHMYEVIQKTHQTGDVTLPTINKSSAQDSGDED